MVQLKNTTAQTLQPGQSITFDDLVSWSGNGECARSGGPVGLRFPGAIYKIFTKIILSGATAATPVQVAITLGGAALPETTMIYTPATADAVGTVSTETYIRTCSGFSNAVTVTNNGTTPVTIQPNSFLSVIRTA